MAHVTLVPGTVKQGYLVKSPPLEKSMAVLKGWKKRWCILYLSQRELFLQYYENEESARGSSPPKSTVSLRFCEKIEVDLEHSHYKNVFAIFLPERIYYFSAPSHYEMKEWTEAICAHLNMNNEPLGNPSRTFPSNTYGISSSGSVGSAYGSYGTTGGSSTLGSMGTYGSAGAYGTTGSSSTLGNIGTAGAYGTTGSSSTLGAYGTAGPYGTTSISSTLGAYGTAGPYGTTSSSSTLGTYGTAGAYGTTGTANLSPTPPRSVPPPPPSSELHTQNPTMRSYSPTITPKFNRSLPPTPNDNSPAPTVPPRTKFQESVDSPRSSRSFTSPHNPPPPAIPPRSVQNGVPDQPPIPPPRHR